MSAESHRVPQPTTFNEPLVMREARILRFMRSVIQANDDEMDEKTVKKLHKVINVRMLDIMDSLRDG